MADPLTILQEFATGKRTRKDVKTEQGSYFIFGDVAFPMDAKTSLLMWGKSDAYYTLEALLFLWDKRLLSHPNYVKDAAGQHIQAVTRPDRRDILDYLRGERRELPPNHDPLAPIPPTIPLAQINDEGPERKKQRLDPSLKAPRIDQLLNDGPSLHSSADPGELRALNQELTADKLAALKAKRKNHQRKTITTAFDDAEMATGTDSLQVDRDLRERERVWRTRENCLEATTRNFSNVLTILQGIRVREEQAQRAKQSGGVPPSSAPRSATEAARHAAAARAARPVGYSRYDQEQFNTGDTNEFGVDAAAQTFVGQSLNFLTSGKPESAPATQPSKPSQTPASHRNPPSSRPDPHSSRPTPVSASPAVDPNRPHKRTSKTPIIIIPAAMSSLVSMYNVKDMLQDMRFVTTDEKKASGVKRENDVLLQRRRGNFTVPYRVVDNPVKLSEDEWNRVVACFVMGPAWQFKGWRWGGNPVEIFSHVAAFHVMFDDAKMDSNVAKWSVTVIQISRTKRHLDKARLTVFWETLDKHIIKRKSGQNLRY